MLSHTHSLSLFASLYVDKKSVKFTKLKQPVVEMQPKEKVKKKKKFSFSIFAQVHYVTKYIESMQIKNEILYL
jgi:hypothetical protein